MLYSLKLNIALSKTAPDKPGQQRPDQKKEFIFRCETNANIDIRETWPYD
jgi:hypothetical protein